MGGNYLIFWKLSISQFAVLILCTLWLWRVSVLINARVMDTYRGTRLPGCKSWVTPRALLSLEWEWHFSGKFLPFVGHLGCLLQHQGLCHTLLIPNTLCDDDISSLCFPLNLSYSVTAWYGTRT